MTTSSWFFPHTSALSSHYDDEAASYDAHNAALSYATNKVLARILERYPVQDILDLTCGTGSQVFHFSQLGMRVVGVDINQRMLEVARAQAKVKGQPKGFSQSEVSVELLHGDMRTFCRPLSFDAVATIFNAIGHLTAEDFHKACRNIHQNLRDGGIYIFDINNLSYLRSGDNIRSLTIDWISELEGGRKARCIQYSTIDHQGVLRSYDVHMDLGADGDAS